MFMFMDFDHDAAVLLGYVRSTDRHRGRVRMNIYDLWKRGHLVTERLTDEQQAYIQARKADEDTPRVRRLG